MTVNKNIAVDLLFKMCNNQTESNDEWSDRFLNFIEKKLIKKSDDKNEK